MSDHQVRGLAVDDRVALAFTANIARPEGNVRALECVGSGEIECQISRPEAHWASGCPVNASTNQFDLGALEGPSSRCAARDQRGEQRVQVCRRLGFRFRPRVDLDARVSQIPIGQRLRAKLRNIG
jgi:hypothetical protein